MKLDLDYAVLIAITATFGGLGFIIGYVAHAAFYSQSAVIFGMFTYLVIRDVRTFKPNITRVIP